jgi:hypothetical protein
VIDHEITSDTGTGGLREYAEDAQKDGQPIPSAQRAQAALMARLAASVKVSEARARVNRQSIKSMIDSPPLPAQCLIGLVAMPHFDHRFAHLAITHGLDCFCIDTPVAQAVY